MKQENPDLFVEAVCNKNEESLEWGNERHQHENNDVDNIIRRQDRV